MTCQLFIVDFGSQYTQLIARQVRQLGVYCEIVSCHEPIEHILNRNPKALILSGGPSSVSSGPKLKKVVLELGIPVLGICYGMQLLSFLHKGQVKKSKTREYGPSEISIVNTDTLFYGFQKDTLYPVWMSHGDSVLSLPQEAELLAKSSQCPISAFRLRNLFGVQFHPEVYHSPIGPKLFENFLFRIAKLDLDWKMDNFLTWKEKEILSKIGDDKVIGGVSGGVDSTVLAVFLAKALGKQFIPVFVDTGLLRAQEKQEVIQTFKKLNVPLKVVAAGPQFLKNLKGVSDPEKKRKIAGRTFIEVFDKETKKVKGVKYLAQGTLYPDVIESISVKGPSHTIKTHHNVGGLPKKMKLKLVEPFRELFKDEVRELGKSLHIPSSVLERHPFPGPGLAIRILGVVSPERVALLQKADAIFIELLKEKNLYQKIWQAFCVLLPVRSVGVMGDGRTYEEVIALRAITSRDGMTADWFEFDKEFLTRVSSRIINEVKGINRVVYDITSKPPATIEWE